MQVTRAVLTADNGIIKMHRGMKDVALANNIKDIEIAYISVQQYEQEVFAQFAIVKKWILGVKGNQLITETIKIFKDWSPIREEVISLMKQEQKLEAYAITKGKGSKHAAEKANDMHENAQTIRDKVITIAITALIIVIILTIILASVISFSIVKSVRIIGTIAEQMVAGKIISTTDNQADFNQIITYKDEMGDIGRAFFKVANSFKTIVDDITLISQGLMTGNLSITPEAEYQGDFAQIKTTLQAALANLQLVVEDIVEISQELVEYKQ